MVSNFFLLLFLVFCSKSVRLQKIVPYVRIFEPRPITSKLTMDYYFQQSDVNVTHTWSRVFYCDNSNAITVNTLANKCMANSVHLDHLLQRLHPTTTKGITKAVFLQFEWEACQKNQLMKKALQQNPYNSLFVGMRIVKGPKSEIPPPTENELQCIQKTVVHPSHVTVLMFDEHPLAAGEASIGYTEEQLKALVNTIADSEVYYVALDALFLSRTPRKVLETNMRSVRVIIYQLEGQALPELGLLRYQHAVLFHVAKSNDVQLMLSRSTIDRMRSYLPNVDWTQRPAKWQDSFVNPSNFYDYLAEEIPMISMFVRTRGKQHFLNDKDASPVLSVPMDRALQVLSPRRRMIFEFGESLIHHLFTPESWYNFGAQPFIMLRVAMGPNWKDKTQLVDLAALQTVEGVTYVLGFRETIGPQATYTEEDVIKLVKAVMHFKMKERVLGIALSAEFLASEQKVIQFAHLLARPEFRYLYVRSGQIDPKWKPTAWMVDNLKWNLKELGKETILHTDWELREKIYMWKDIRDPSTTTTTSTKGTGTTFLPPPPTTIRTTTEYVPPPVQTVSLSSPLPPSTTLMPLNYSQITFPTVKSEGQFQGIGSVNINILLLTSVGLVLERHL